MEKIVESFDINGNAYQVPVSELTWRPSVYGIVFQAGKILLSPQFEDNRFDVPGGGMDLGELPEETVVREVKEETGMEVIASKIVGATSRYFTFAHEKKLHHVQSVMLYYLCDLVGGELSTDGFDEYEKEYARMAVWLPISELSTIKVASTYDWRELVMKAATNENIGY